MPFDSKSLPLSRVIRRTRISKGFDSGALITWACRYSPDIFPVIVTVFPIAQLAGNFAFEAARRLWLRRGQRAVVGTTPLTDRQRDCALWVARGKGDWEIARILGVSEETVAQHVRQACGRYGVNKRTLLLVQTLFDGTLTFTDIFRR